MISYPFASQRFTSIKSLKLYVFIFIISICTITAKAQIFQPDGLRMPGTWNNWTNTSGMGGDFDLQRSIEGTGRWTTTFQYNGASGSNTFKFVSTSFSDPWGNQWAGNTSRYPECFQQLCLWNAVKS